MKKDAKQMISREDVLATFLGLADGDTARAVLEARERRDAEVLAIEKTLRIESQSGHRRRQEIEKTSFKQVRKFMAWISSQSSNQIAEDEWQLASDIAEAHLFIDEHGTMLYHRPVRAAADTLPPLLDVPCVDPNYSTGWLTIRQLPDFVPPSGQVEIVAVHRSRTGKGETVRRCVTLELTKALNGDDYWYGAFSLKELFGDLALGDDFVFCVDSRKKDG